MKYAVLIPALNPSEVFVNYIQELIEMGAEYIIVVNDGSDTKNIFNMIEKYPNVVVLHHSKNYGKGKALKTGFKYYKENIEEKGFKGVITVDSDGQHSCVDVIRISKALDETENKLILGARDFNQSDVPNKSKFGNQLTRRIFKSILHIDIHDTQTGLRGIPGCLLERCLHLKGNRFEYETAMLIEFGRRSEVQEINIETIYHDDNKGTHFNPVLDSIKIYYIIFQTFIKYVSSSLFSFVIDYAIFFVASKFILSGFSQRVFLAVIVARVFSSIINFSINRKLVFESNGNVSISLVKYYILCASIGLTAALLVSVLHTLLNIDEMIIKIFVDSVLFWVSYRYQHKWIFRREE